jgi:hypothetical protein
MQGRGRKAGAGMVCSHPAAEIELFGGVTFHQSSLARQTGEVQRLGEMP